jgi:hypothetical protein
MNLYFPFLPTSRENTDYSSILLFFHHHPFGSNKEVLEYFSFFPIEDQFMIFNELLREQPENKILLTEAFKVFYKYKGVELAENAFWSLVDINHITERDIFFIRYKYDNLHIHSTDRHFLCYATNYFDLQIKKGQNPIKTPECLKMVEIVLDFFTRKS